MFFLFFFLFALPLLLHIFRLVLIPFIALVTSVVWKQKQPTVKQELQPKETGGARGKVTERWVEKRSGNSERNRMHRKNSATSNSNIKKATLSAEKNCFLEMYVKLCVWGSSESFVWTKHTHAHKTDALVWDLKETLRHCCCWLGTVCAWK